MRLSSRRRLRLQGENGDGGGEHVLAFFILRCRNRKQPTFPVSVGLLMINARRAADVRVIGAPAWRNASSISAVSSSADT
jgi:hypothetical protein